MSLIRYFWLSVAIRALAARIAGELAGMISSARYVSRRAGAKSFFLDAKVGHDEKQASSHSGHLGAPVAVWPRAAHEAADGRPQICARSSARRRLPAAAHSAADQVKS